MSAYKKERVNHTNLAIDVFIGGTAGALTGGLCAGIGVFTAQASAVVATANIGAQTSAAAAGSVAQVSTQAGVIVGTSGQLATQAGVATTTLTQAGIVSGAAVAGNAATQASVMATNAGVAVVGTTGNVVGGMAGGGVGKFLLTSILGNMSS